MEFTLNEPQIFPAGTTVKIYAGSGQLSAAGRPLGPVLTEAVAGAEGVVTFSGLTEKTRYIAGAEVGGTWRMVSFTPDSSSSVNAAENVYNVKRVTGATDDAPAIQSAINLAAVNGGIAFIPAGSWKLATTLEIKSKVLLEGAGPATKISLAAGANIDMIKSAAAGAGGVDFAQIRDLWLDGNKTNNPTGGRGVDLDGRRTRVTDVWISNCKGDGLRIRRSAAQLTNAEGASDQFGDRIYAFNNDGNGVVSETNDVSFSHCRAAANAKAGFLAATGSSATVFNDCHAWGAAEYGFNMEGSFDCVNCQAEGASVGEVRVKAGGRWIGGRVFVAGTPTNVPGFLLVENASTLTTRGVVIKETGTGGAFKAMAASVGSNSSLDFFLEGGESLAFTKEAGGSFSESVVVRPILFGSTKIGEPPPARSLASAEEIVVPPSLEFVSVTGVAEVKKLKATFAGHRVTLKFTSTAKVLDGENLKLVSTFEATADDTLSLVCDGTNWFEAGRSAN